MDRAPREARMFAEAQAQAPGCTGEEDDRRHRRGALRFLYVRKKGAEGWQTAKFNQPNDLWKDNMTPYFSIQLIARLSISGLRKPG